MFSWAWLLSWGICAVVLIWLEKCHELLDLGFYSGILTFSLDETKTTWVPGVTALLLPGVEAGLPFQFEKGKTPAGAQRARGLAWQACAPSSSTLPAGPCFPQTYNCSKGLGSEAERAGHRQVHVGEVELNSCRQAEEWGSGRWSPCGGTVSSHSPPPHKPSP